MILEIAELILFIVIDEHALISNAMISGFEKKNLQAAGITFISLMEITFSQIILFLFISIAQRFTVINITLASCKNKDLSDNILNRLAWLPFIHGKNSISWLMGITSFVIKEDHMCV